MRWRRPSVIPGRFAVMGRIPLEKPESAALLPNWKEQPGMLGVRLTFHGPQGVLLPGPGADRSLSIKIDPAAPDGFIVHLFARDSPIECRDYVRAALTL